MKKPVLHPTSLRTASPRQAMIPSIATGPDHVHPIDSFHLRAGCSTVSFCHRVPLRSSLKDAHAADRRDNSWERWHGIGKLCHRIRGAVIAWKLSTEVEKF